MTFTETEIQIFGRLSAIEYVLEVMLANELANQDSESTAAFKSDLVAKQGYIRRGPVSIDLLQAIEAETKASLENFVRKVDERERDIRARIAPED